MFIYTCAYILTAAKWTPAQEGPNPYSLAARFALLALPAPASAAAASSSSIILSATSGMIKDPLLSATTVLGAADLAFTLKRSNGGRAWRFRANQYANILTLNLTVPVADKVAVFAPGLGPLPVRPLFTELLVLTWHKVSDTHGSVITSCTFSTLY
jgi:hypothetical protein